MWDLPQPPDGYVAAAEPMARPEALIAQGLLESNGIPAALVAMRFGPHTYARGPSLQVAIHVPADRVDEARALLAG